MRCDCFARLIKLCFSSFNPRTYMRCDALANYPPASWFVFQSTHLHEVRRRYDISKAHRAKFQSTHLHEVRHWPTSQRLTLRLFQSTHLHEVRQLLSHPNSILAMFQSTHLHEVRPSKMSIHDCNSSFNPRTYMRCDHKMLLI